MKRLLLLFVAGLLCILSNAQALPQYSISSPGQGKDGGYLVKVSSIIKTKGSAVEVLRKCAVHGVIFRGFTAASYSGISQKPLVSEPGVETTRSDVFGPFFSGGEYQTYASYVTNSYSSIKIKAGQFEVSATFIVDKERLIQFLESRGVIKGFSNLW